MEGDLSGQTKLIIEEGQNGGLWVGPLLHSDSNSCEKCFMRRRLAAGGVGVGAIGAVDANRRNLPSELLESNFIAQLSDKQIGIHSAQERDSQFFVPLPDCCCSRADKNLAGCRDAFDFLVGDRIGIIRRVRSFSKIEGYHTVVAEAAVPSDGEFSSEIVCGTATAKNVVGAQQHAIYEALERYAFAWFRRKTGSGSGCFGMALGTSYESASERANAELVERLEVEKFLRLREKSKSCRKVEEGLFVLGMRASIAVCACVTWSNSPPYLTLGFGANRDLTEALNKARREERHVSSHMHEASDIDSSFKYGNAGGLNDQLYEFAFDSTKADLLWQAFDSFSSETEEAKLISTQDIPKVHSFDIAPADLSRVGLYVVMAILDQPR